MARRRRATYKRVASLRGSCPRDATRARAASDRGAAHPRDVPLGGGGGTTTPLAVGRRPRATRRASSRRRPIRALGPSRAAAPLGARERLGARAPTRAARGVPRSPSSARSRSAPFRDAVLGEPRRGGSAAASSILGRGGGLRVQLPRGEEPGAANRARHAPAAERAERLDESARFAQARVRFSRLLGTGLHR